MPPPTASDAWLAARRFGIVIDAGSSGSRLQIYSWRDARVVRLDGSELARNSLPVVEKGTKNPEDSVFKVEPGISSFYDRPDGVTAYLAPLLEHARVHVPPSLHAETPIFLLATAGMRLLSPPQQFDILKTACDFIRFHSRFLLDKPSAEGPCGSSIRVISGEEEGLFGWIAINYLLDGFAQTEAGHATYGFMDMGGASTQIAFEPTEDQRAESTRLTDVTLRLVNGRDIKHGVFVTTWLGYGTNQARERYVSNVALRQGTSHKADESNTFPSGLPDPCLPRGLILEEGEHGPNSQPYALHGTGLFEQCLKDVLPLLNKDAPCPDTPCPINGVHVPQIDFSVSHFIGVSEYWYSSEHVFGLGGAYDFVEFERAASQFCSREWTDILAQHENYRQAGSSSDRFEVDSGTADVGLQPWGSQVEISRLQMQCFKAAWIVNVLHEGIGLPRIVDPEGNVTSDGQGDRIMDKAAEKGLGRPAFQSVDAVGDTSISWTLGRIVLEASREIPPLLNSPSLSSPNAASSWYANEDAVLHFSSSRFDLGHSMFNTLVYLATILFLIFAFYRLRFRFAAWTCNTYRALARHGDISALGQSALEEARTSKGKKLPPRMRSTASSQWASLLFSIRASLYRLVASIRRSTPTTGLKQDRSVLRNPHSSPARIPPTRSASTPSLRYQYSSGNGYAVGAYPNKPLVSQSTLTGISDDAAMQSSGHLSQSFYTLPRSRNNSQMSLTNLAPRQLSSRSSVNSGQQTPIGGTFHIDD